MPATAADPYDWQGMAAAQQFARERGFDWNPSDPYNWTYYAQHPDEPRDGRPSSRDDPNLVNDPTLGTSPAEAGEASAANDANQGVFDSIVGYLQSVDLGGLFTVGTDGAPGGWLWDQIVSGVDSAAMLQIRLEDTDVFKQRYGVIADAKKRAQAGEDIHIPTVAEVRDYEQKLGSTLRAAGIPEWMFDTFSEKQALMSTGQSIAEIEQKLGTAWERVTSSAPEVRQAFEEMYGVGQGDGALAAVFLDPQQTVAKLEKSTRAAYTKGTGRSFGLTISKEDAERIASLPGSDAGITQDLQQIARMGGVFTESFGEAGTDLTAEGTGVQSVFFGNSQAQSAIERRIIERRAINSAGTGGALVTSEGVVGVR